MERKPRGIEEGRIRFIWDSIEMVSAAKPFELVRMYFSSC